VPAFLNIRGRSYRDGVDITPDEVYKKLVKSDVPITTSQPPPGDFAETYRHVLKEADEIVSIHATSKLSGIYNSAVQAREMVNAKGRIEVVDSASVSMGLGLVAIAAARVAKAGVGLPGVLEETRKAVNQVHIWAVFDTLKYVLRGGRLGRASSLLGSVLNVKPVLTMKDGVIHPAGFVRTRARGIEKLLDNLKRFHNVQDVGIVHSSTPEEAQTLRCRLSALVDKNRIYVSRLGPALGVHGGPGTLILALRASDTPKSSVEDAIEKARKRIQLPSFHAPKLNISPLS
ncbi:MAG: DegV family protein, partial [Dehalococcoidia bacterium]